MSHDLKTQRVDLACKDEIDETSTTCKWNKKAEKDLQELNNDCNLTAGLEALLSLAVGTRAMLRRNIDTGRGLVNGDSYNSRSKSGNCLV